MVARVEKSVAVMRILKAASMTPTGRRAVAQWLRNEADTFLEFGPRIGGGDTRVTRRFDVNEGRAPATFTIYGHKRMQKNMRRVIADWLRHQADALISDGKQYGAEYRARYLAK